MTVSCQLAASLAVRSAHLPAASAGTASLCVAAVEISDGQLDPLRAHNGARPALTGVDNWLLVSASPTPSGMHRDRYPRASRASRREIVKDGKINSV
jgi:hypothetical protein